MKKQIRFAFHILTHPFDGFWDMRFDQKGSIWMALLGYVMLIVSNVIQKEVTNYLFNDHAMTLTDIGMEIQMVLIPSALFCIGNWSVTTLLDGEGRFKDIVMALGYSMYPLSIIPIPLAFLSLAFTYSESVYYTGLIAISGIWFFFLLFAGIMTIHQYSVTKMIATTVLTIFAMIILVFIGLLFFELISQFFVFATAIYQELSFRY